MLLSIQYDYYNSLFPNNGLTPENETLGGGVKISESEISEMFIAVGGT